MLCVTHHYMATTSGISRTLADNYTINDDDLHNSSASQHMTYLTGFWSGGQDISQHRGSTQHAVPRCVGRKHLCNHVANCILWNMVCHYQGQAAYMVLKHGQRVWWSTCAVVNMCGGQIMMVNVC